MVEKQGFEEKEELKSKLESAMEEKFKMEKVRFFFPLCVFFCLNLVKCNLTKLTTTSLAVKRFISLAVRRFTSVAVKRFTSIAVKRFTSLAVKRSTSLAVHKLSGLQA